MKSQVLHNRLTEVPPIAQQTQADFAEETYGIAVPSIPRKPRIDEAELRRAQEERDAAILRAESAEQSAVISVTDGGYLVAGFRVSRKGIEFDRDITPKDWEALGQELLRIDSALSWWVGDWAAYANAMWNVKYKDIAKAFSYDLATLKTYASVCRAVPPDVRREDVPFSIHRMVAKMEPDEQRRYLDLAAEKSLSVSQMRKLLPDSTTPADEYQALTTRLNREYEQYRGASRDIREWLASEYERFAQLLRKG